MTTITTIPVTEPKELKWKMKDGTLVPIPNLSNEELKLFSEIVASKITVHYRNFEFFTELQEQMDTEIHKRLENAKALVAQLELVEKK